MKLMNRILLLLILCLCCGQARAQYVTNLTLLKNQFLTGEPVVAVVSITNRSGADVIVGGHGAPDWIQFEITQSTGQRLAPVGISSEEPITLPAGGTTKHTVEISGGYSTSSLGTFNILANVLHPISGQYFMSNKVRMTITDTGMDTDMKRPNKSLRQKRANTTRGRGLSEAQCWSECFP